MLVQLHHGCVHECRYVCEKTVTCHGACPGLSADGSKVVVSVK